MAGTGWPGTGSGAIAPQARPGAAGAGRPGAVVPVGTAGYPAGQDGPGRGRDGLAGPVPPDGGSRGPGQQGHDGDGRPSGAPRAAGQADPAAGFAADGWPESADAGGSPDSALVPVITARLAAAAPRAAGPRGAAGAPAGQGLPAVPAAGPEITITIGRIEVRAAPAPAPRPRPPARPRVSLADFLGQQRDGRHE